MASVTRGKATLFGAIVMAFYSFEALAEVSDKIASLPQLGIQGLVLGFLGFGLARFRPWWSTLAIAGAALLLIGTAEMLFDPFVGPAIRKEQGWSYEIGAWMSAVLPILAVGTGLLVRRRVRSQ